MVFRAIVYASVNLKPRHLFALDPLRDAPGAIDVEQLGDGLALLRLVHAALGCLSVVEGVLYYLAEHRVNLAADALRGEQVVFVFGLPLVRLQQQTHLAVFGQRGRCLARGVLQLLKQQPVGGFEHLHEGAAGDERRGGGDDGHRLASWSH